MSTLRLLEGLEPKDLGLDRYKEYRVHPVSQRPVQLEVIEYFASSKARVVAACVPTGFGKSLIAMSLAKLKEKRTAIITATHGLEEQYMGDMSEYGLRNIRGKSNYTCGYKQAGAIQFDCKEGVTYGCRFVQGNGCTYEVARDRARRAQDVVSNYDYWMNINVMGGIELPPTHPDAPNPIELLILDEAHEADKKLSNFLSVWVYEAELPNQDAKKLGEGVAEWQQVAKQRSAEIALELSALDEVMEEEGRKQKYVEEYHKLEKQKQKFERLETIDKDWVIEKRIGHARYGRTWNFDVKWPGRYSEQYLFCGVRKIVLMSATLKPHHLRRLGVAKADYEFREWEPVFPKQHCPVYYFPARTDEGKGVRITAKSSDAVLRQWVTHIDEILSQRLDRRALVLTTSYKYQKYFLEHSKHSRYMIANNSEDPDTPDAQTAFERFIKTAPPAILCSPSFGTGWDFKDDRCELLVISKVPLKPPPSTSKLAQARWEQDNSYFDAETMSDIEQAKGRLQRSSEDRGEVVIADGTWAWWGRANSYLAAQGFVDGVRQVYELPKAPERLYR